MHDRARLDGSRPILSIDRRAWLRQSAAGLCTTLLGAAAPGTAPAGPTTRSREGEADNLTVRKRERLRTLLHTRDDIDAWLAGKAFPFCKYDPELGYLHIDRDFKEGLDGAVCSYRYDRWDARRTIAWAERSCRINTYGNSFTSCEQVSDGETWQEVLAAHLGEPVRNFGIGGYSVYQAYLRMKREEQRVPARYIIFNIFDDDHYRNLLSWQRFRFGVNRKSPCPSVPHVKVDPQAGRFVEVPNPCPTPESLYRLCDLDDTYALFADDEIFNRRLRREESRAAAKAGAGPGSDFDDAELTGRAVYATTRVVEKVEEFAAREGKKMLYVLSFGADRIKKVVQEGKRFDQPLVDFLDRRKLPYIDMLAAHVADSKKFAGSLDECLSRYFIGHYNPLGNHFCAFAMKQKLVGMLDPPPPAYVPEAKP